MNTFTKSGCMICFILKPSKIHSSYQHTVYALTSMCNYLYVLKIAKSKLLLHKRRALISSQMTEKIPAGNYRRPTATC